MTQETPTPGWVRLVRAGNPGPMTLDGTNSWVLAGPDGALVVDPGPDDPAHLDALAEAAEAAGGARLVLLTHGHPDHSDGAWGFARRVGAPLVAGAETWSSSGRPLTDGERLDAGGLAVTVLSTPGHTADSISLLVDPPVGADAPALVAGDTVLGRGSAVIAAPDGDLGAYLVSLQRLAGLVGERPGVVLLPGHGPVPDDPEITLAWYLRHRADRLEQVRQALAAGARDAADVVRAVYADVDPVLRPAAEQSVQAQLDYLAGDLESGADPR